MDTNVVMFIGLIQSEENRMPNTIADFIKKSAKKLSEAIGSPYNSESSIYEQAQSILVTDKRDFQRLGKNFLVPKKLPDSLNIQFNKFLAEPLLREGSLLLDRCLQQRKEYQELHAKWFEACVQIDELLRLSEITEQEIYKIDTIQTQILESEESALTHQRQKANENVERLSDTRAGWANENSVLSEYIHRGIISNLRANLLGTGPMPEGWGDSFTLISEGTRHPVHVQRKYNRLSLDVEETQYSSVKEIADDNLIKLALEKELKDESLKYKKARNEVARLVAIRRAEQLVKHSGALNFLEQMRPIKMRFKNDLISAWLRLNAAHDGFQEMYGDQYSTEEFPAKLEVTQEDVEKPELTDLPEPPPINDFECKLDMDELVTWAQLTNTWLAAFLDTQQQVTRSFSLLRLLDNDQERFDAGKETGSWSFKLNESHFYNSKFVRMRSFAVQIDSARAAGSWNVSVTPPTKAIIRRSATETQVLSQPHIGTLHLGRVSERVYAVMTEGAAPPKLYNGSPVGNDTADGEWKISVIDGSTSGATLNDIRDIDIHLSVALV